MFICGIQYQFLFLLTLGKIQPQICSSIFDRNGKYIFLCSIVKVETKPHYHLIGKIFDIEGHYPYNPHVVNTIDTNLPKFKLHNYGKHLTFIKAHI